MHFDQWSQNEDSARTQTDIMQMNNDSLIVCLFDLYFSNLYLKKAMKLWMLFCTNISDYIFTVIMFLFSLFHLTSRESKRLRWKDKVRSQSNWVIIFTCFTMCVVLRCFATLYTNTRSSILIRLFSSMQVQVLWWLFKFLTFYMHICISLSLSFSSLTLSLVLSLRSFLSLLLIFYLARSFAASQLNLNS